MYSSDKHKTRDWCNPIFIAVTSIRQETGVILYYIAVPSMRQETYNPIFIALLSMRQETGVILYL